MRKFAAFAAAGMIAAAPAAASAAGGHHMPCGKDKPGHTDCGRHRHRGPVGPTSPTGRRHGHGHA